MTVASDTVLDRCDDGDIELSPRQLRALAHRVAELVIDRVTRPSAYTTSGATRGEIEDLLLPHPPLRGQGGEALLAVIRDHLLVHTRDYRHPRHFGHQRPAPLVATAIADFATVALNPSVTIYEGGLYSFALERRVMAWLSDLVGYPDTCAGALASGGAEANLTALLCARERCGVDTEAGTAARKVFASVDAHYSIERAAHVLGLGPDALVRVPVDDRRAIDLAGLGRALEAARRRGDAAAVIVATAGTTSVGAFDDIEGCARLARAYGAWLHVDGAHGASALLDSALRDKLRGVAAADSVTWNPHKLMWVSSPCSALLVRDRRHLARALAPGMTAATYLVPDGHELAEAGAAAEAAGSGRDRVEDDTFRWTLACTRYCAAMRIYAAFMVYGQLGLQRRLRRMCRLAGHLYARAQATEGIEVLGAGPELNIVCFRPRLAELAGERGGDPLGARAAAPDDRVDRLARSRSRENAFTRRVRDHIARGHDAYVTGVLLDGVYWLRAQFMSENTTEASVDELLAIVGRVSEDVARADARGARVAPETIPVAPETERSLREARGERSDARRSD